MTIEKPWLRWYEPHVPEHIDYPRIVLPDVLRDTARQFPDHPAIIFKGNQITFGEFDRIVNGLASTLQGMGVKKGTPVAIHLPNCPQFPMAYYAVLRAGGIVVPCNPLYQAHEMKHQLNNGGAEIIFTLSSTYPLIKRIRSETPLRHVIVAEIKTYLPLAPRLLFGLLLEKKKGHKASIAGDGNTYWFKDLLKNQTPPLPVEIRPEDTAVLMYTGGTTGVSKGAELTHKNILVNAYQCKTWLNASVGQERMHAQMPLFHSYGMTICMNLSVLIASPMILIPDPRDLDDVIKSIQKYRPTLYPGVPAMYNAINNFADRTKYDLTSIKICISGAAGIPVEVQELFQKTTGARLVEGYGLSEASPVTHANPIHGENRIGTIGLPWPDTEVKITDAATGKQVMGVGEPGELCIRGPQVMRGYWKMPAETEQTLRPDPEGGDCWLYTGDLAVMDKDGYFKIVDRKKDMILGAGGYNIYPREIEDILYEHPKVMEAAAVGIPVPGKGERIKLFVHLKPGMTATEDEFIQFCKDNLAIYKVPKFVEFRDELPKNAVGKILRRELRDQAVKKMVTEDEVRPQLLETMPTPPLQE